MSRTATLLTSVAFVVFVVHPKARADDAIRAELRVERGVGAQACMNEDELRATVASRLGFDPFITSGDVIATVRLARDGRRLRAVVELVDRTGRVLGSRTLTTAAPDCDELGELVALTLAMSIDSIAIEAASEPSPAQVVHPTPEAPSPQVESPSPSLAPPIVTTEPTFDAAPRTHDVSADESTPRIRPRLGGYVLGGVDFGHRPRAGALLVAGVSSGYGALRVELEGKLASRATIRPAPGESVRLRWWALSVAGCGQRAPIALCGFVNLGRFEGSARGIAEPRSGSEFTAEVGASGRAFVRLSTRLLFLARTDVALAVRRTEVLIDEDVVWTSPRVTVALVLGIAVEGP